MGNIVPNTAYKSPISYGFETNSLVGPSHTMMYFIPAEPIAISTAVILLQFRLADIQPVHKLEVELAMVSVHIRTPFWQRHTGDKFVRLKISAVNYQGQTGPFVSIKVNNPKPKGNKYRIKTKIVNLPVPKTAVQKALESEDPTLELYLFCEGCEDLRLDLDLICRHNGTRKQKKHNKIKESTHKRHRYCGQSVFIDPVLTFNANVTTIREM